MAVIKVELTGSLASPLPLLRKSLRGEIGKIRSRANACMVLGAISIDPIADESVAAPSPMGIIGPQMAILLIAN